MRVFVCVCVSVSVCVCVFVLLSFAVLGRTARHDLKVGTHTIPVLYSHSTLSTDVTPTLDIGNDAAPTLYPCTKTALN
jgi:hypothetical protein